MKYSAILLSAIAATGAMAAPQRGQPQGNVVQSDMAQGNENRRSGTTGTVKFDNTATFTALDTAKLSSFSFAGINNVPSAKQVTLTYDGAQNDAAPRCKANDKDGNTFVVKRDGNLDFTFAQGKPWAFQPQDKAAAVAEIICDAKFQKLKPEQQNIVIELGTKAKDPNPTVVPLEKPSSKDLQADTEFNFVTLKLGPQAFMQNPNLRCQISVKPQGGEVNAAVEAIPIELTRGDNNDNTFGDGFKGAWRFTKPSKVTKVECSEEFKKRDPAAAPATGVPTNGQNQPGNMEGQETEVPAPVNNQGAKTAPGSENESPNSIPNNQADVSVQLGTTDESAAGSLNFVSDKKLAVSPGGLGPVFSTAQINFKEVQGKQTNKNIRCRLLDAQNKPLTVTLSAPKSGPKRTNFGNTDSWDILDKRPVAKVECDPKLQADVANA